MMCVLGSSHTRACMQTRSTFTFVECAARPATQWRSITAYRLVRLRQCVSSTAQVSRPIYLTGAAGEELLSKILASLPAKALAQAEATCVQWYTSAPAIALELCPVCVDRTSHLCRRHKVIEQHALWHKRTAQTWRGGTLSGAAIPAVASEFTSQQQWKGLYFKHLVRPSAYMNDCLQELFQPHSRLFCNRQPGGFRHLGEQLSNIWQATHNLSPALQLCPTLLHPVLLIRYAFLSRCTACILQMIHSCCFAHIFSTCWNMSLLCI